MWDQFALVALWVAMIALIGPVGDFPLNDDWLFARAARAVVERGYFEVPSFSAPNVGPQAYWGALFCLPHGFSFDALRLSTLVLGLVGILAFHSLFIAQKHSRSMALLAGATLAMNPLYVNLSCTFMTDVPFFALVMLSIVFVSRHLRGSAAVDLAIGLAIAFVTILLRQLAIIVLIGFAVAHLLRTKPSVLGLVAALWPLALGLAIHVWFSDWLIASGRKPFPSAMVLHTIPVASIVRYAPRQLFVMVQYVALFLLPLSLTAFIEGNERLCRGSAARGTVWRRWGALVALATLLLVVIFATSTRMPSGTNLIGYQGFGPLTLKDTSAMDALALPRSPSLDLFWNGVTVVSAFSAALFCIEAGRTIAMWTAGFRRGREQVDADRRRAAVSTFAFLVSVAAGYLCILLVIGATYPIYDRYLPLLVALAALLIPRGDNPHAADAAPVVRRRRLTWIAVVPLACIGALTIMWERDYLSWNGARWTALAALSSAHVGPARVDGGYEFNGWNLYDPWYSFQPRRSLWVVDDEYVIASAVMPGYAVQARYPLHPWFGSFPEAIVVLHRR